MATYNQALKGYVADVPKVVFNRCDKAKFYFDELSSATVSANIDTMDINGGWSLFPLAVLPGSSTFTMTFTSAKFDTAIFSMANAIKDKPDAGKESDVTEHAWRTNSDYVMSTGEHLDLNAQGVVYLLHTPVAGSVYIPGMTATTASEPTEGTYRVATDAQTNKTLISFSSQDISDGLKYVDVVYDYIQEVTEAIVTNKESAIGEAVAIWPVYGSGEDCSESSIIGYYIVKVFRARITQIPGMDTSYKSAATFNFELTALDAKRSDEGAYSMAYFKK